MSIYPFCAGKLSATLSLPTLSNGKFFFLALKQKCIFIILFCVQLALANAGHIIQLRFLILRWPEYIRNFDSKFYNFLLGFRVTTARIEREIDLFYSHAGQR